MLLRGSLPGLCTLKPCGGPSFARGILHAQSGAAHYPGCSLGSPSSRAEVSGQQPPGGPPGPAISTLAKRSSSASLYARLCHWNTISVKGTFTPLPPNRGQNPQAILKNPSVPVPSVTVPLCFPAPVAFFHLLPLASARPLQPRLGYFPLCFCPTLTYSVLEPEQSSENADLIIHFLLQCLPRLQITTDDNDRNS